MIDTARFGKFMADAMEQLEQDFPDCELGEVLAIVEVKQDDLTTVTYNCTDDRQWVQAGLMSAALRAFDE